MTMANSLKTHKFNIKTHMFHIILGSFWNTVFDILGLGERSQIIYGIFLHIISWRMFLDGSGLRIEVR